MEGLFTCTKEGVRIIRFNTPERKNALSSLLYEQMGRLLNEDAKNDEVVVTIITGTGDYFTSGNDIKSLVETMADQEIVEIDEGALKFKYFVESLINYPKIIIAVVNGPAIGVGVTMLALCDVVYASDRATFQTPFVNLGLCAEACSSYMFPRIMGRSRACEMLLLGKKLSAQEAFQSGLVSEILPHNKLDELFGKLQEYGKLPVNTVRANKNLIMGNVRQVLCECNDREYAELLDAVQSDEFSKSILEFMTRKSKL